MKLIGGNRFIDQIEPLPGEKIIWEGGASRNAIVAEFIQWVITLITLFGFIIILIASGCFISEWPENSKQRNAAEEQRHILQNKTTHSQKHIKKTVDKEEREFSPERLKIVIKFILPGIIIIGLLITWLKIKKFWYVITTERICLQSGILSKRLVSIDLDKVISVKSMHSIPERLLKLQSIEIIHPGISSFPGTNNTAFINPYVIHYVPVGSNLLSNLMNVWLPRDNNKRIVN